MPGWLYLPRPARPTKTRLTGQCVGRDTYLLHLLKRVKSCFCTRWYIHGTATAQHFLACDTLVHTRDGKDVMIPIHGFCRMWHVRCCDMPAICLIRIEGRTPLSPTPANKRGRC
jgi:hypothetical protein